MKMGLKNDLLKARSATGKEAWTMMVENRLNKLFLEDTQTHDRYGLHASAIIASENEFCYREQVLSLFYKMNQGELLPIPTLRVFAQGNTMHEKWYSLFRKAGIDIAIERTLFLPEYDLNFTIDALLNLFNDEVICDVKSVNTFIFNKQKGHPSGEKQINFYCWALTKYTGIPHRKGFVLMDSKNDQNFRAVPVKYDKEKVRPYVDRLKEIQRLKKVFIDTGKLPARKCDSSKCKRAEKCNMHDACWKCGMGRIKLPEDIRKGE